jgi:hypothetical protein
MALPPCDIIFILGARRSGTTLLNSILCRATETNDHLAEVQPLTHLMAAFEWSEQNYQRLTADFFTERSTFNSFRAETCNTFLEHAWRASGRPAKLVLKNPELSLHIATALTLWPQARMLACVRDPRDQIASELAVRRRLGDAGAPPIAQLCANLARYLDPIIAAADSALRRIQIVRYEDLVGDPDNTVAALAATCGLDLSAFSPKQDWPISEHLIERMAPRPSFSALYGKPITADRIGAYAAELSSGDVNMVEHRLAAYFVRFGYAVSGEQE